MSAALAVFRGVLGFFGGIGPLELVVIAGLAVLIFGHRLPKVARSAGRSIQEFKKGLGEVGDQVRVEEDEQADRLPPRPRRQRRRPRRDGEQEK